jgi:hypothetical protein
MVVPVPVVVDRAAGGFAPNCAHLTSSVPAGRSAVDDSIGSVGDVVEIGVLLSLLCLSPPSTESDWMDTVRWEINSLHFPKADVMPTTRVNYLKPGVGGDRRGESPVPPAGVSALGSLP